MVRLIFNRFLNVVQKSIPALSLAGVFFFSVFSFGDSLALATDLFEKNEWDLCRRECRRALLSESPQTEHFQLLQATSLLRTGDTQNGALRLLALIEANKQPQISAIAAYELGRIQWMLNEPESAFSSFSTAFNTTTNNALFLRASCSLFLLLKENSHLKAGQEALLCQISTSRSQWYGALFHECAKPHPENNHPQNPNWLVRFYRSQISPAIGNRCVLEPSCSEYYHQAHSKHGWKSIPMIADRFFREPDVSNSQEDPVIMPNGQIRYRDPLENHDFWMKK